MERTALLAGVAVLLLVAAWRCAAPQGREGVEGQRFLLSPQLPCSEVM